MSRFSEVEWDDLESLLAYGRWMGRRKAVLNGRPGKIALRDLERVLILMPHKRLITGALCDGTGVCANGAWLYRHYIESGISPRAAWQKLKSSGKDRDFGNGDNDEFNRTTSMTVTALGITETLAIIIAFINDEEVYAITPEDRYTQVLSKVQYYIREGVK